MKRHLDTVTFLIVLLELKLGQMAQEAPPNVSPVLLDLLDDVGVFAMRVQALTLMLNNHEGINRVDGITGALSVLVAIEESTEC